MRHCPKCGTAYTDESLRFCLTDGSILEHPGEQVTVVQSGIDTTPYSRGGQMRVEIPQTEPGQRYTPAPPPEKSGPGMLKIVLVVGLFVGLLVIGFVGAGALIYFNKATVSPDKNTVKRETPTPAPTATASNAETDKLREQIANLEKRLNEQANANRVTPSVTPPPDQPTVTSQTARVNSPGDGFLALRSFPSSESGERIAQIPHGAAVTINGCLPRTRIGNKTGRWCRASYGNYNGWVFDAWLNY